VLFSLKLAIFIPDGLNLYKDYPELLLLPFDFSWLLFPLFFIYTQKISIFSDQKVKYWVLFPGIASFMAQVFIYFLPYDTKMVIAQSFWHELTITAMGIFYSWGIGIWNLRFLNKHKTQVENTFSYLEHKLLEWVRIFLIFSLSTSVLIHILYYISPVNYYFKIIFSIFDLAAIYWLSVNGIMQQNVLSVLAKKGSVFEFQNEPLQENDHQSTINHTDLNATMKEIDSYMKTSEAFLRSELTIIDLAENLQIHPKKISSSINTVLNQNFNSYVNQLRIKKAEEILAEKPLRNYSIEGIGREVGFHSKSAFYSAFKKETGTTPTKYKDKIAV
jgi:AraC-like DNA-binding protein